MSSGDDEAGGGDSVAEQAARWVARLASADATEEDRRAFEAWRRSSPAHAQAYEDLAALWDELKGVRPAVGPGAKGPKGGLLAALLAVGLGAAAVQTGAVDRWRADHATGVGEVRTVVLPDGTEAALDTDTAIALDFTASARTVTLLRGQAFFAVAKDAARPFTVESGALTAAALGTRFQVDERRDQDAEVAVEEGLVEVAAGGRRLRIGAGQSARRDASGALEEATGAIDVRDATAWRDGRLVFSGRPLDDVLRTIGRYRRGPILVLDDRAAALRVSGAFDLADTDAALAALGASLPIRVTNLAGALVLVRSAE